jgi:COMPASS component SWD3
VTLWDLRTGGCLKTLAAHAEPVTGVDFNAEGTCLVSGSYDGLVRVWDVGMGQCLKTMFAEGSPAVSCVKWSPNGRYVLVSSLDSTVRLWGVKSPSCVVKTYRGHRNERLCVSAAFVCVPAGKQQQQQQQCVVSGSEDGKVYLWGVQSRKVVQRLGGHDDAVLSLAAHPSQGVLASGGTSGDGVIRLWCTEGAREEWDGDGSDKMDKSA